MITPEQLEMGLRHQKQNNKEFICRILVNLGFASEEKIFSALSKKINIPYIKIKNIRISPEAISKTPAKLAAHYKLIPVEFENNVLTCAVTDPLNIQLLDDMKLLLGFEVKAVLAGEKDILESIYKYYGVGAETLENINGGKENKAISLLEKTEDLETEEDASVIKFVNQILLKAIEERATDIHIEPFEDELRLRFRIDGILYPLSASSSIKYFYAEMVSRIKIMARLNIAERRMPQDGRIKIKVADIELDLRVSIIPTIYGESVQIRILSRQSFLELEKLGLSADDFKIVESLIILPHGIIFITGPTGSGKTTTLYAALKKINSERIKVVTIEDPVEYQIDGINQIQVLPKIGLTFANGLRSVLRHDPDVLMVGEVRDYETAEIAIRCALTGHLVFSTLHTNDAAGAITRLLDMGVEPFLISSSLECIIAQRLVRLICEKCKTKIKLEKHILKEFGLKEEAAEITVFEGRGCEECKFTGYKGRTAIYEILRINEEIRQMILAKASSQDIRKKAIEQGMKTLLLDGFQKVLLGKTTISEVLRVAQKELLKD
ncbi:MAG: GspE/PulE family protein [Candidatus Omnitrophica bacterium]|nr:GspE/PulE family protein [Candidatus Omnitrophota bacterium]